MKECHEEKGYPIETACKLLHVARSAYHRWAAGKLSHRAEENERLADKIEKIHEESPDKGYRRINDDLRHDEGIHVNDKRVLRICRCLDIRSTIKYSSHGCTRNAKNPQFRAENILDRQFYAEKPNEKWLTDVTEFKWYGDCIKFPVFSILQRNSCIHIYHCAYSYSAENSGFEGNLSIILRSCTVLSNPDYTNYSAKPRWA